METKKDTFQIDVKEVFTKKNPSLAKKIPRFIYSIIRKIIHEKEINELLEKHGHKRNIEFVSGILNFLGVTYKTNGTEFLEKNKVYIFASNHPLGGLDGLSLLKSVSCLCGDVIFLVNDLLMNITQAEGLLIPINKHGSLSRTAIYEIDKAHKSDSHILVFPAGLASRKIKGKVIDLEWKKAFVKKAIQYERDIVPVHISGRNSNLFYAIANFRKIFRIKANLEMFLLPHEMFKQKTKSLTITFGKPIKYTELKNNYSSKLWAKKIKDIVYQLPYN